MLVVSYCDVDEKVLCGCQVIVVQKRGFQCHLHRVLNPVLSTARSASHEGETAVFHHCPDVLEVDIDVASFLYDFSYAPDSCCKHLVCLWKGILKKEVAINSQNLLVVNYQKAVHVLFKFIDTVDGLDHGLRTLAAERNCDNSYCEYSFLPCHRSYHRCRTGSGTASHSCSDEEHFCPVVQNFLCYFVL